MTMLTSKSEKSSPRVGNCRPSKQKWLINLHRHKSRKAKTLPRHHSYKGLPLLRCLCPPSRVNSQLAYKVLGFCSAISSSSVSQPPQHLKSNTSKSYFLNCERSISKLSGELVKLIGAKYDMDYETWTSRIHTSDREYFAGPLNERGLCSRFVQQGSAYLHLRRSVLFSFPSIMCRLLPTVSKYAT